MSKQKDIEFYNNLKKYFPEAEFYILKHAVRVNGVVDVWRNNKTCYCLPDNKYVNIEDQEERISFIRDCVKNHSKRNPIKKLPSGNMSWQEYVNNKNQPK